jgi:hypothetical protein
LVLDFVKNILHLFRTLDQLLDRGGQQGFETLELR